MGLHWSPKLENVQVLSAQTLHKMGPNFLGWFHRWSVQALINPAYKDLGGCRFEYWYKTGTLRKYNNF